MKLIVFLILAIASSTAGATEVVREMSVPEKFAEQVQEKGLFKLGDVIAFTVKLESLNDNIFHGLLTATDVTHFPDTEGRSGPEGDDRSLTFKAKLVTQWDFEQGSLALEMFTTNYSRLAYQRDQYGIPRYRNHATNKVFTEHLIHNEAKVNFVKDLKGHYFMRITGSHATIDDDGLGFDIQAFWHEQFLGSIEYEAVEHFDKQHLYGASLGMGKKIVLKENGSLSLELEIETGVDISNIENVARSYNNSLDMHASWQTPENSQMYGVDNFAPYIETRVSTMAFNRIRAKAYDRRNTSGINTTGLSLGYTFHPGKLYDITLSASIEKIEDAFNRIYRHDIGTSNKTYGLDLEITRRFGEK